MGCYGVPLSLYLALYFSSGGPSWFSICTVVGDAGRDPKILKTNPSGPVGQCSCWSKSFAERDMATYFADVIPTCRDTDEANSRDGRLLSWVSTLPGVTGNCALLVRVTMTSVDLGITLQ